MLRVLCQVAMNRKPQMAKAMPRRVRWIKLTGRRDGEVCLGFEVGSEDHRVFGRVMGVGGSGCHAGNFGRPGR